MRGPAWWFDYEADDTTARYRVIFPSGAILSIAEDNEAGIVNRLRHRLYAMPDEDGGALLVLFAIGAVGTSHIVTSGGVPVAVVTVLSRPGKE